MIRLNSSWLTNIRSKNLKRILLNNLLKYPKYAFKIYHKLNITRVSINSFNIDSSKNKLKLKLKIKKKML